MADQAHNNVKGRKTYQDQKPHFASYTDSNEENSAYRQQKHVNRSQQQEPSNRSPSYSSQNEKAEIESIENADLNNSDDSVSTDFSSDQEDQENAESGEKVEELVENEKGTKWTSPIVYFIILVFGILFSYGIYLNNWDKDIELEFGTKSHKTCSFQDLKLQFPQQDKQIWNELKIGVEDLLNSNPTQPKVYLYLHDDTDYSKKLINDIADTSSACFDPSSKPIKLNKDDFLTSDYGETIEKYKENIHSGSVLIVLVNLNEIPGKNARALHAICDTYTPINNITKILIILTLAIDSNHEHGKPLEIAEAKLNEIWSPTIQQNELSPLITRVTDSVFRLHSE